MSYFLKGRRTIFNDELLQSIIDKENDKFLSFLLSMHSSTNTADSTGNTLLHYAALHGNELATKYLINSGCNVDVQNKDLKTPLMLAVEGYFESTINVLLEANADIKIVDSRGKSVLRMIADLTENIPLVIVKMFIDRVKREFKCSEVIARILFKANWPLFNVVTLRDIKVTKFMLELGSPVDSTATAYKLTALHGAILLVDPQQVEMLVDYGADVNVKCADGSSPMGCLHNLDRTQDVQKIIRILLERNTKWTDCDASVPMQIYDLCVSGNREIIRTLMEYNIDLSVKDCNGESLMHYFAENKNPGVFEELRGRSFDVNVDDDFGMTPLHKAVWCGNVEAIEFFIECGADVRMPADNGFPPIFYAFVETYRSLYEPDDDDEDEDLVDNDRKDERIVEILLEHGAQIEVPDKNGVMMSVFEMTNFSSSAIKKPIIAHLAMLDVLERPLSKNIREAIASTRSSKRHFKLYKRRYEHMKACRVYESVTLLELLTTSDRQILHYARNRQLVLNLANMINDGGPNSYHYKKIQKRLADAVVIVECKNKAVETLDCIIAMKHAFCSNSRLVADLIVNYLEESDWLTLKTLL